MSNSSGSILKLSSTATALSNVNLLIIIDNHRHLQKICESLATAGIDFTYDTTSETQLIEACPKNRYSAILYDLSADLSSHHTQMSLEKLQWWCHFCPQTPLILITEALGDEQAVNLIQSGVDGYLLRQNLAQLPNVLQQTLYAFLSKQAIASQQQDLIKQQQARIEQLETKQQHWRQQQQVQRKHQQSLIKQQQARIEQLEAEQQHWLEQEQGRQEHLSHLKHELRSPISSIVGFARMLKEQYYGELNEKQFQYVSGILSSGEHLLALVNNYLDIVKIKAKKHQLNLEKLAVGEICQAALFILDAKAKQKELALILDLDPQLDFCIADSVRLKQILINLIGNAIKFTETGSVTLQVTLQEEKIHFAVIDTGIGIAPKNLTKLFKPFPQITSYHESTGLGLALSRELARLHGGDITVTSELGKGSCFDFYIPQYQQMAQD